MARDKEVTPAVQHDLLLLHAAQKSTTNNVLFIGSNNKKNTKCMLYVTMHCIIYVCQTSSSYLLEYVYLICSGLNLINLENIPNISGCISCFPNMLGILYETV